MSTADDCVTMAQVGKKYQRLYEKINDAEEGLGNKIEGLTKKVGRVEKKLGKLEKRCQLSRRT